MTKELHELREHYDNRITIREHNYEEEIQNLVNMVNADAQHSKKVVEMLNKQKIKSEDDMKVYQDRVKGYEK